LNVKLIHMTRNNSPEDPVTVTFSVIDESGYEQVLDGICPSIPGTRKLERLEENLGSVNVKLTLDDLNRITPKLRRFRCKANALSETKGSTDE
jgi:hypothetical protein